MNISITDYHNMTGRISKSGLDKIAQSPAHFRTATKETDAMRIGRITHEFILEGVQNFVSSPFDSFRTKEAREWRDSQTFPIITTAELETIYAMRESVLRHPEASRLLSDGQSEQTFFFDEPTTGAPCRCRTDWMTGDGVIVDLKTTTDASPKGFAKAVWKFRYHVQDAFYTDGVEASTGCRPKDFVFIAVEKTAPFGVGVYRLSEGLREEGRELYLDNVKTWMECTERGEWPAYSNEIIEIV